MTGSLRRQPGERVALVVKARVRSRTEPAGQVVATGPDWSLEGLDDAIRFRVGNVVVDFTVDELRTAATRAALTVYDDDYGAPLARTSVIGADGTVADAAFDGAAVWGNDRFTVQVVDLEPDRGGPMRISVHDHHRNPDISWRLLQRIKNEVAGPHRWAVEWFPDEDQLVDEANERHMFVWPVEMCPPPTWLCYDQGRTIATPAEATAAGAVQAPLPAWYPEAAR